MGIPSFHYNILVRGHTITLLFLFLKEGEVFNFYSVSGFLLFSFLKKGHMRGNKIIANMPTREHFSFLKYSTEPNI